MNDEDRKKKQKLIEEGFEVYVKEPGSKKQTKETTNIQEGFGLDENTDLSEHYFDCKVTDEAGNERNEEDVKLVPANADTMEQAQTWFAVSCIIIIAGLVCSFLFPYLTILALKYDTESRGTFFRVTLYALLFFLIGMGIYMLLNIKKDDIFGIPVSENNKMVFGVFFLFCAFFAYISVTFAKVSQMRISQELDFSVFDPNSPSLYVDVFGLSTSLDQPMAE